MRKIFSLLGLAIMLVLTTGFISACHCGDGEVNQDWEECDDGNWENNDGCSSGCSLEFCGDSILQTNEECDDGNTEDGDGCTANCTTETPVVPEFGLIAGITTVLGALGAFFIMRRK
jgi:cysteine-rich repeat protein